ncbi:PIF1-like helicase [Medicago truncatula]|uniref:PIF1-like helicase n=1 Tax=Medicago truncatula TaxID=3880 RepID=A0A072TQD4_MEDTR|nr:PIF1-like helicase [Medicago truncatula]
MSSKYTPISAVSGGRKNLKMCVQVAHIWRQRIPLLNSYDTPYHKNIDGDAVDDIHTPEFLNTIVASGLPNHRLRLKVGAPVMLLRNMDQSLGLCNGTRLIITKMRKFVLEGRVISGSNIGEKVFIPRLSLTPSDNRIHFKFKRSQGQSLEHVGVYLPSPIFSHGQLYVAISRVTSRGGLKILINDDDGDDTDVASNVVYREVFFLGVLPSFALILIVDVLAEVFVDFLMRFTHARVTTTYFGVMKEAFESVGALFITHTTSDM